MDLKQTLADINRVYRAGMEQSQPQATDAQTLLRAAVEWHQQHEGEVLPAPLLAILVAARRVC